MSTETYDAGSAWSGWVIFAAIVMFTIGAIDIIQGIAALAKDETFLVTESGLLVTTNFTAWGWAFIIWGIVMIFAAAALFAGREWGRWFAIVAIIVNGIVQIAGSPRTRCGACSPSGSRSSSCTRSPLAGRRRGPT